MPENIPRLIDRALALNAFMRAEIRVVRAMLALREAKSNPRWSAQPRAPAGRPDGGQWVSAGGGASRPPSRSPPRIGHNRPPGSQPAPERPEGALPPTSQPYVNWGDLPDNEYFAAMGALTRQRNREDREAALRQAIRSIDPNVDFDHIISATDSGVTYESALRLQLHVLRIQWRGPLGMQPAQWPGFRADVTNALQRSPHRDAEGFLRGSAVTGFSFTRREVLNEAGPRDFDAAIVSPGLFAAARRAGFGVRGRGTRTRPLNIGQLAKLGVQNLPPEVNGREVTYVIFRTRGDMLARPGPAIPLAPQPNQR